MDTMSQEAPYPTILAELVEGLRYWKPGYQFWLTRPDYDRGQGSKGLTLIIGIDLPDAYHPEQTRGVNHLFPVPPAAFDRRSWQRWLFDRLGDVDLHERCECFEIDGVRPYAPSHGPGNDPYLIREIGTELDVRTSFRGVVKDG